MLKCKKDSIRSSYESWKLGGCVYVCHICGTALRHSAKLIRHLSKEHNINNKDRTGLSRVLTKHINCLGCGKKMLYDYGAMKAHFRDSHHTIEGFEGKIDLPQYFIHYIYFGQAVTKETIVMKDSKPLVTEKVANLCRFQCPLCSARLECMRDLYSHINQGHQRTFK